MHEKRESLIELEKLCLENKFIISVILENTTISKGVFYSTRILSQRTK